MSRNITLRKALQLRKTIAGDMARLTATITKYNAQRVANPHIDVLALLRDLAEKRDNMVALKTAISQANIGLYPHIAAVEEAKSAISFLEGLNVEETGRDFIPGTGHVDVKFVVALDYTQREQMVKALKTQVEAGMEAIDNYNTATRITIEF